MQGLDLINSLLWLLVAIVALFPLTVFYISYVRVRSRRLLRITMAFFLFFLKGAVANLSQIFLGCRCG